MNNTNNNNAIIDRKKNPDKNLSNLSVVDNSYHSNYNFSSHANTKNNMSNTFFEDNKELGNLDEEAFKKGLSNWNREDWSWFTFVYKEGMTHSEHLQILSDSKDINKIGPGRVPSTMLYAFDEGVIVGRVSIRHELNDFLLLRGGHIRYAVNEIHRKKGYGKEILNGALEYCKNHLKLEKVLITCSEDNNASVRMIENVSGKLENTLDDPESGERVRRYWLELV